MLHLGWQLFATVILLFIIIVGIIEFGKPPRAFWLVVLLYLVAVWIVACRTGNPWFKLGAESELKVVNNSHDTTMVIIVAPKMNRQYVFGTILPGDSLTHVLHMADTPIYVNINGTSYQLQHTDEPMNYRVVVNKP